MEEIQRKTQTEEGNPRKKRREESEAARKKQREETGAAEKAQQKEKVRISVRNLVEFILRSGDIDNRTGGFADKDAMQEGSRIHRKIQGRMGGDYRAEVSIAIDLDMEEFVLTVDGRADGIFTAVGKNKEADGIFTAVGKNKEADGIFTAAGKNKEADGIFTAVGKKKEENEEKGGMDSGLVYIDEIKGVYRDVSALAEPYEVHLAQAKCYACIYARQQKLEQIGVQMTYCNIETEEIRRFRTEFSLQELNEWFDSLVLKYRKWAKHQIEWRQIRQASIRGLVFPFAWREGQKEMASSVYRTILRKKTLFIQAPTGTGKTLSTVFPAVKAVGEELADRIFYATAKTVTRTVAEDAYRILREAGLKMKVLTMTAKEKICFLEETECNPDACPYARGHYDRVNEAVFDLIEHGEVFDRTAIERQAEKWQVCPFELGLDVSVWSDAVICDYNYIFDPRAKLKRFFAEGGKGGYLFLIDEAHNLVERAREMFSAALYKEDFLELKKQVKEESPKMARALNRCNAWMLEQKRETEGVRVWEGIGTFPVYLMNLCGIMEDFLEDSRNQELNRKVLDLYFTLRRFLDVCDRLDENYVIYTELCGDGRFLARLYCVDVSENLQECLDKGRSTVYFSATFLPIQYYKSLLSTAEDNYAIYAKSVFDPGRRLVMIGTDTSSRYTMRTQQEFRKMAEYVVRLIQAKRGNYMVFFSSYRMMEEVAQEFEDLCFELDEEIELTCQRAGMDEGQREEFLEQFEQPHERGLAGFCVMGGVFGEGIDLRNDRLIGAILVGTGLPQVCREREILKSFYDRRGEDGFFYAYLCPGMNKVLQSAGRVIRTEEDAGVILLLDERFAASRYAQMFPAEWTRPKYCTLKNVRQRAEEFWIKLESQDGAQKCYENPREAGAGNPEGSGKTDTGNPEGSGRTDTGNPEGSGKTDTGNPGRNPENPDTNLVR